jgi:hypothetical protein
MLLLNLSIVVDLAAARVIHEIVVYLAFKGAAA